MKPQNLTFDSVDIGSPEETLRGLQTQRTTYAMAYNTLCKYVADVSFLPSFIRSIYVHEQYSIIIINYRYSGLVSKIIFGVAKGMDYKPGNTFTPGSNHHTWNAVLLNGVWELVDTRFAKRPVLAGATGGPSMQYEFDDHFFMTNPQKFIYTHFPDESKWQMLDPLVTMETFCNMPVMTPHFFALGMDLLSHKLAYVHSTGKSIIELKYPKSKRLHLTFSVISDNGTEEYEGVKLVRYAMLEANAGKVTFRLRLPVKGKYTFIVYAKEDNPNKSDNVFAQVCEYIIEQEEVLVPKPFPYPPCAYQSWGPGIAFYQFNLFTDTLSAVIKTKKGVAKFEIMSSKPMQFRTRLVQHQETSEFEGYVTHKIQGNLTMFTITAPSQGEFGLEIYAKDPDTESKKMRHVAQYLILCEEEIHTVQLPKLPSGFLGLQPMLVKYGVSTITHSDPVIHTDTNYLEIRFGTSQNMRFTTSLFETETQAEYSEYVFIQSDMNVITLLVCLPKTGFFTFCVHGNLLTDNSQQIPGLFNYLIHCNEMKVDAIPYPKQYGFWKEGCSMMKPLAIKPVLETTVVPFKVRIPRATIVAVVVDNDWTPLVLHPDSGVWEGDIHIEPTSQGGIKVVLVASFGDDQSKYATLLEYKL